MLTLVQQVFLNGSLFTNEIVPLNSHLLSY